MMLKCAIIMTQCQGVVPAQVVHTMSRFCITNPYCGINDAYMHHQTDRSWRERGREGYAGGRDHAVDGTHSRHQIRVVDVLVRLVENDEFIECLTLVRGVVDILLSGAGGFGFLWARVRSSMRRQRRRTCSAICLATAGAGEVTTRGPRSSSPAALPDWISIRSRTRASPAPPLPRICLGKTRGTRSVAE